jgi:hypothetical protein
LAPQGRYQQKRVIQLVGLEIKQSRHRRTTAHFLLCHRCPWSASSIHQFNCDNHKAKHLVIATLEDNKELLKHSGISSPNADSSAIQELFGILKTTITNDTTEEHVIGTPAIQVPSKV